MDQIYDIYCQYTTSFSPCLNSSQVLLYIYKQFFNIKNHNLTQKYSTHITQLLTNSLVLRKMQENLQNQNADFEDFTTQNFDVRTETEINLS